MELKQFLQSYFNKQDFIEFISKRFYGFAPNLYENEYLGKVRLDDKSEIGFFVFKIDENKDIENTRVGFHKELKKYADENLLDSAIGAFYNDTQKIWRLSFIRFSYDDNHKKQVTSQKRFTFLLGNDKIKTAHEQLKNLKYPKIIELEKAFGVEAVTKEFYKGIVKEYEKLLNEFLTYPLIDDNSKKEFAIRLIGRILFIKFLNKKSLVPDGIFEVSSGYYHEKLEPLFFEQLNTPKSERKQEFQNDKIPFLNGGLFEPLHLDYYEYNGMASQYINTLKIDDNFFVELYEHLNQYNFTIDENSIEDSDLSIDPEMLGRIFENLLAEINPETSQNARKSTGSYYTPREIVEYMVSSSLLEYIKTKIDIDDETLKTIIFKNQEPKNDYDKAKILSAIFELKILDPACGSGAFPMGLLQKIVKILNLIDEDATIWFGLQTKEFREIHKNRNKDYIRKLSIIKNTIFGIDIQPIAIEISKLRFFLSLIVDEEGEPEPLPNLEFKFVCANSLLPLYEGKTDSYKNFVKELQLLKDEYFESSGKRKKEIVEEYLAKRDSYLKNINEFAQLLGSEELTSTDIMLYNPFDPVSVAPFFDSDFMFNIKDGFDIVIGNPPYIDYRKIDDLTKMSLGVFESYKYTKKGSIYVYFIEQGIKLLKTNGVLSFINPYQYLSADSGLGIRKFLINNVAVKSIVDVSNIKVFESASTYTCINLFIKSKNKIDILVTKPNDLNNFHLNHFFLDINPIAEDKLNRIILDHSPIIEKIDSCKNKLIDFVNIFCGTSKTGFRESVISFAEFNTIDKLKQNEYVRFLETSDIQRYEHKVKSFIAKDVFPPHVQKQFETIESIFLARMTKHIRAVKIEKNIYAGKVNVLNNFKINSKYILALLNSKLVNYYYLIKNESKHLSGGYFGFDIPSIEAIPIVKIEDTKPFEILVDYVMFLKQQENKEYMSDFFERVIDIAVYELYFQDELHKYNYGILEILKNESFEFDNTLNTIEVVYKKWSDKNHKIAYNVHFIDSLDIIKVIEGKK